MMLVLDLKELEFDEESHVYLLNGVQIPSVTQLMKPLTEKDYQDIPQWRLDKAADKGTAVHEGIEIWLQYGIDDVPDEYSGYLDAFKKWWTDSKAELIDTEVRVYHKTKKYAGTCDLLCKLDGKITLVDYKTSVKVKKKSGGVQLEGYVQALASQGIVIEQKAILHIKKTGDYEFIVYPLKDAKSLRVFNALKDIYDFQQEEE